MAHHRKTCLACEDHQLCIYRIPAFAKISKEDAMAMVRLVNHREYAKGEVVFNEGERSQFLIFFRYGKIKLVRYGLDGEESLVDILGKGDIYGGDEIFIDRDYSETGVVAEETGVCMIRKDEIRALTLERPYIGLRLAEYLNQKLLQNRRLMEIISTKDTLRKLVMFLVYYADLNETLELEISQADIANSINLTKETVNRKLAELQNAALIQVNGKKKLNILSMTGLNAYLS